MTQNSTLTFTQKRRENRYPQKELYKNIYSSFCQNKQSGNSPNAINRITNQLIAVYSFNGILLNNKKERTIEIPNYVTESILKNKDKALYWAKEASYNIRVIAQLHFYEDREMAELITTVVEIKQWLLWTAVLGCVAGRWRRKLLAMLEMFYIWFRCCIGGCIQSWKHI